MNDTQIRDLLKSESSRDHEAAFQYFYENYYGIISSYILNNSGNYHDVEDVFQDGIIVLYEQVISDQFKQGSTLKTFLFAICKNLWMNKLRKASKKNEAFGIEYDFLDSAGLAFEKLIHAEETQALAALIEQGGEDCKRLLILYYYDRRKMDFIADKLGLASADVAKNKKNRCLNKIRTIAYRALEHFGK